MCLAATGHNTISTSTKDGNFVSSLPSRPIYVVVLASGVEGSFDVKRVECN